MTHIVLPQAFRNMVPVLLTQSIILFQDVSLVYVLSITDFVGAATKVAQRDGRIVEMYLFVAVVYFLMSYGSRCWSSGWKRPRRWRAAESRHGRDPEEIAATDRADTKSKRIR